MKNFDNYLYYPAIRTRPAELLGYRHLSNEQKDELLPLVTLGSWPRQDGLGESMAQTEQALDGRPYMLDLTREATYQLSEIRGLLDDGEDFRAWREFVKKFDRAIPVIQTREAKIPRITRQARAFVEAGRKVAFRIVDFRNDTPKVAAALAALPSTDSALVVIDAGYIRDSFQAISIACADVINEIREDIDDAIIALISSSFPASVASLADPDSGGQRGLISMLERPLHEGLGGSDVCIYGDHSSIHARVYPTSGGRYSCRIDYPLYDGWAFERRTDCKSEGYIDCAKSLIETYPEIDEEDTWGARAIVRAAQGDIDGMKTAAMWIAARVNMHIARQLDLSESGPLDDEESIFDE
jgi:hypothetical protein